MNDPGLASSTSGIERIVVFRALQLGDMLCSVPALRALRRARPTAHIALVGLPWAYSFVDRYAHLVDEFIVFPGALGFPEQVETNEHLPEFMKTMRTRRFHLAIQLHGSGGIANDLVREMAAHANAGFLKPGEEARAAGTFIPWPDELPEIARYLALMDALGIDARDDSLEIPLTPLDKEGCEALIATRGIDVDRVIVIHPGAQLPSRRWPIERFARVASRLGDDGWQIVVTGSRGEAPLAARIAAEAADAIDLTGQTSLGCVAALLAQVPLIVCNDTGLSHVAAAMKTRSVVIASGGDARRWAPLDHDRHRVLADYPSCRPCAFRDCPYGHPCALNISVEQVLNSASAQLDRHPWLTALPHAK
jgi:ADP-heptose:LPS heptosyltransferase